MMVEGNIRVLTSIQASVIGSIGHVFIKHASFGYVVTNHQKGRLTINVANLH
jgi:hypothetical protein